MKRLAALLLVILCLSGCDLLAPDEYLSVTPHEDSSSQLPQTDAIVVEDYDSLKRAILSFVRTGQTEGVIHASNYSGVMEDDLPTAAYEVSKLDPLGAYAVDYMTHSCVQIISHYEARISITFRRTAREIADIHYITARKQMTEPLEAALQVYTDRIAFRVDKYDGEDQDISAIVEAYCADNPTSMVEIPQYTVSVYPENGSSRIIEVSFLYSHTPEELKEMEAAVEESLNAAAEYIRYRQSDYDKAQLLYSYLTQRFQYEEKETVTPLYDALCSGVADPKGLAQAWKLICDRAEMECFIVSGMRDNRPYTWNILRSDGYYRHLDLAQCILSNSGLSLNTDGQMSDYYWNSDLYPACYPRLAAPVAEETDAAAESEV